jgi:hypothetical protein
VLETVGGDILGVELEQPPELALVGREHSGSIALPEELEPARVGVQAVGVHEQGRLHGDCHAARELLRTLGAADARAQDHRAGALRHLLHVRDAGGRVEPVVVRQPAAHLLEQPEVDRLLHRARHGHLHVPGAGTLS